MFDPRRRSRKLLATAFLLIMAVMVLLAWLGFFQWYGSAIEQAIDGG